MDQVLQNNLSLKHPITVRDGLAGVGLGITHLVKEQFIEGDINELLEDIDNAIYRKLAFLNSDHTYSSHELLHLIYYLYYRLLEQTDRNQRYLFQELIIKMLNLLYASINDKFIKESITFSIYHYQLPLFLMLISKLLELDFYNYRIYKILDELRLDILSRFPVLHSNRLYLLWGILSLEPYLKHSSWKEYINLLYKEIDLPKLLSIETKNKTIFISNGLSMIYLLLFQINKQYPNYNIKFDPEMIYNHIITSDAWSGLEKQDYYFNIHKGLFNGFPGV